MILCRDTVAMKKSFPTQMPASALGLPPVQERGKFVSRVRPEVKSHSNAIFFYFRSFFPWHLRYSLFSMLLLSSCAIGRILSY